MKFHDKGDIIHIYGLTQDPITKEYIFVMKYIDRSVVLVTRAIDIT